jgi:hypothetical protein
MVNSRLFSNEENSRDIGAIEIRNELKWKRHIGRPDLSWKNPNVIRIASDIVFRRQNQKETSNNGCLLWNCRQRDKHMRPSSLQY